MLSVFIGLTCFLLFQCLIVPQIENVFEVIHQLFNYLIVNISFPMGTSCLQLVITELLFDMYFYPYEDFCHGYEKILEA